MSKKIIGITLASAIGLSGAFAGGMVLSNHLKDKDYDLVIAEKQEDIDSIATSLGKLNHDLEEKEDLIFTLQEQNRSLNNVKEGLESTLDAKLAEITTLNEKITTLENEKTELQVAHSGMIDLYNELVATNNANEQEIEDLNQHILTLKDTIDSTREEIEAVQAEKEELEAQKQTLETLVAQKQSEIERLSGVISTLQTEKASLQETYNTLQESYASLETQYNQLVASSNVKEQQITSLNSQISELNTQISTLQSQIEQLQAQVENDPEKDYFSDFAEVGKFMRGVRVSDRYYVMECGTRTFYRMDMNDASIVEAEKEEGLKNPSFEIGYHHFVQQNGNLLLADRTSSGRGIYLYNPNTNYFSKIASNIWAISDYKEFSDGTVVITSNSSGATTSTVLHSDYTFTDYNYTLMSYICEVEGGALFKGTDSTNSTKVYIFYDSVNKTLETLQGDPAGSYTFNGTFTMSDGNVLLSSYGAGGTLYYDSDAKTVTMLSNRVAYVSNFHECANGIVLMDSTSNTSANDGGLYAFDMETHELTRLTTYSYNFDTFEEDENGVTMYKATAPSTKYYYSFETGEAARL